MPQANGQENASREATVFALVGNPNSGKSTLFNKLTGLKQKIGNYPGVTVERKEGTCYSQHGKPLTLLDLPGTYSLIPRSPDECVVSSVLLGKQKNTPKPDAVICVIDASNLERNLYLASQVIELGLPTLLVINMIDTAQSRGQTIDTETLSKRLGVPIIESCANKGKGLIDLRLAMSRPVTLPKSGTFNRINLAEATLKVIEGKLSESLNKSWAKWGATKNFLHEKIAAREETLIEKRYQAIQKLCEEVLQTSGTCKRTRTERIDHFLLHPIWGGLALLGVLGLLFYSIFALAETPIGWIESGIDTLIETANTYMPEGKLTQLITEGVIAGVGSVLTFFPQILMLLLFIGLLESSGYMARAAFLLDRLMGRVGLPGKAFIPLLSSYACAIPGIMATRTIECPKDRLTTILVAPFTSCSARLPVYLIMIAVLTAATPEHTPLLRAGLLLLMYLLSILGTFGFAWFFKKTLLKGNVTSSIMELPAYRVPSLGPIISDAWNRTKLFIRRAGTVILGISIIMWFCLNYPESKENPHTQLEHSIAGQIGKGVEPIIAPLGYDWKTGIALIASFAAREVFVSTTAIIYNIEGSNEDPEIKTLSQALHKQKRPNGSPVFTPLTCLSLMVFYVFALQCLSTIAVVRRETNSWRWPIFQFSYMTFVAYAAAFIVYQGGILLGFN